jgi:hypothetical protein
MVTRSDIWVFSALDLFQCHDIELILWTIRDALHGQQFS